MLKEIRDQLITDLKSSLIIKGKIAKYRGEFEEGSDWNPTPKAIFLQVIGKRARVKSNAQEVLKYTAVIKVYAGANFKLNVDGLDVAEDVIDLLVGNTLTVGSAKYLMTMPDEGMDLIYYEKGFEAYAFTLLIQ